MTKNMLIDATHTEETRVVVMDGNRLDEYDVETSSKKQLKGNIYLAKVIRVEPSLQAAFVEYGGNRHGFLAFSEIHPDYYQIPVADREKLIALQAEDIRHIEESEEEEDFLDTSAQAHTLKEPFLEDNTESQENETSDAVANDTFETMGGENDPDDDRHTYQETIRFLRNYKIQEVIRRRQILLVQVVKEERGNKGAALTTYLSLAGRYCVLMPNALKGGGISRKITSLPDRKRLKDIMAEINVPTGMAMIIRTAGAQRSRPEIHKDCEYLLRLWDEIRDLTMRSIAPTLVYEEASLIKRAIRDIYSHDIHDIIVDGEDAWKAAREFMRVLMPQNTRKLRLWKEGSVPLFSHHKVEDHLNAMFSPTVQLKSGGYLVINQTEALVAIDVNSGRSIKERGIEETALRTNQEAASEIARQLKLRDLAGLIVIDFIDMESRKHNIMVERRLKEALHHDRARIQVGHISHFGLLEMSRQRLRPSVAESSFVACPHCNGSGVIRGTESSALHALRLIEEESSKHPNHEINIHLAEVIAIYILNHKRTWLSEIERHYNMKLSFVCEAGFLPAQITIERMQALAKIQHPQHIPAKAEQSEALPNSHEAGHVRTIPIQSADTHTASDNTEREPNADLAAETWHESQDNEEYGHRRRRRRRRRTNDNAPNNAPHYDHEEHEENAAASHNERDSGPSPYVAEGDDEEVQQARPAHMQRQPQNNRRRNDRFGRRQDKTTQPVPQVVPAYQGPTPANPFERFDIFDVIEQVEAEQITPAPDHNEIKPQQADSSHPRRRRQSSKAASTSPSRQEEDVPSPITEDTPASVEETAQPPARRGRRSSTSQQRPISSTQKTLSASDEAGIHTEEPAPENAPKTEPRSKRRTPSAASKATSSTKEEKLAAPEAETAKPAPARGRQKKIQSSDSSSEVQTEPMKTAKRGRPKKQTTKAEEEAPAIKPIIIDEDVPKPAKKVGWWKR